MGGNPGKDLCTRGGSAELAGNARKNQRNYAERKGNGGDARKLGSTT